MMGILSAGDEGVMSVEFLGVHHQLASPDFEKIERGYMCFGDQSENLHKFLPAHSPISGCVQFEMAKSIDSRSPGYLMS